MPEERELIRVADEWWGTKKFIPTDEQKKRKKKTGSLYRRDEQVDKYEVHHGRFV